jgi:predicted aldo/keto reductase-like oxidoreductase
MEPVKGGSLVDLPEKANRILAEDGSGSPASYAIRYAASFDGVFMVLSGMGSVAMMEDNVGFMKDFKPLSEKEHEAVEKVRELFRAQELIACTECRYCTEQCPQNIQIPGIFSIFNNKKRFENANAARHYAMRTRNGGKASECIACGLCEEACPQHLEIRRLLREAAAEFEK